MREKLLAAQGFNRVQPGGTGRRIEAEADPNHCRHTDSEQDSKHTGHKRKAKLMGEQVGPTKTKRYRYATANRTKNRSLNQKLIANIGGLHTHSSAHEVWGDGERIDLTPKEFRLLETLAREPGRAFSRLELVQRVFGLDYEGFERTVDMHMMNLRKKIEPSPNEPVYLQTVYGVGYKFRKEGT